MPVVNFFQNHHVNLRGMSEYKIAFITVEYKELLRTKRAPNIKLAALTRMSLLVISLEGLLDKRPQITFFSNDTGIVCNVVLKYLSVESEKKTGLSYIYELR